MLSILRLCNAISILWITWVNISISTSWLSDGLEIVHFLVRDHYVRANILDCLLSYEGSVRRCIHLTKSIILPIQWHTINNLLLISHWILIWLNIRFDIIIRRLVFNGHSVFLIVRNFLTSHLPERFYLIISGRYPEKLSILLRNDRLIFEIVWWKFFDVLHWTFCWLFTHILARFFKFFNF